MSGSGDVDAYLAALPRQQRDALEHLRAVIRAAAPDATETISYKMPAFKWMGRVLVYYSAFRDHCSFFPASKSVIAAHSDELREHATGKGTLQFTPDRPIPDALIRAIVAWRLEEIAARAGTSA